MKGDLESLKNMIEQMKQTKPLIYVEDLEKSLLIAVQTGNAEAIPILVAAGAERLDCALCIAVQLERIDCAALLMLFKAIITKDACALYALLSLADVNDSTMLKEAQPILKQLPQVYNVCYFLEVAIRKRFFEAAKCILFMTGVSRDEKKVTWSGLKLSLLLSAWISFMVSWVVDLNLSHNCLVQLPCKLFTAFQLQQLDLSHNQLVTVRADIFNMPNLNYLNLSHNQLEALPDTDRWGRELFSLNVSNNNIREVPTTLQYSVIEILNLSRNKLTEFPLCVSEMDALRSLDVSFMPIVSIPKCFTPPKSLQWLIIAGTKIQGNWKGTLDREDIFAVFKHKEQSFVSTNLTQFCREGLYSELRYALYYEKEIAVHIANRTPRGNTLLHEAVECDQPDIVQLLLLHGFSPNVRGKAGLTPLHVASAKGYVVCVKALLESDADVTLRDDLGHDAFMKAERSKNKEAILKLLASKGEGTIQTMARWIAMASRMWIHLCKHLGQSHTSYLYKIL